MSLTAGPPPYRQPASRRPSPVRGIIAGILLAVAALLTVPAILAHWAHNTLDNTDTYVATVAPLAHDPAVQDAVAKQLSNAVASRVELSATFEGAVRTLVEELSKTVLDSPTFVKMWAKSNAKAQQAMVTALAGGSGAVSVQGQDVMLDLSGLADDVKSGLVEQGLGIAADISVPKDAMQVRLMSAGTLSKMQAFYRILNPVSGWLIYAVAALYLLAILVARARGLVVVLTGVVIALSALTIAGLLALGGVAFSTNFSGEPFQVAADAYYSTVTATLTQQWPLQLILGLGIAAVGGVWMYLAHRRNSGAGVA